MLLQLGCCFPSYRGPLHHASPTQLLFSELSRTHSNSLQLGCCFPNYRGPTPTPQLLFSELSRTHCHQVSIVNASTAKLYTGASVQYTGETQRALVTLGLAAARRPAVSAIRSVREHKCQSGQLHAHILHHKANKHHIHQVRVPLLIKILQAKLGKQRREHLCNTGQVKQSQQLNPPPLLLTPGGCMSIFSGESMDSKNGHMANGVWSVSDVNSGSAHKEELGDKCQRENHEQLHRGVERSGQTDRHRHRRTQTL